MAKVLIVDDCQLFRGSLTAFLHARYAALGVDVAENQAEARRKLRDAEADIVFVEVKLNDGNGLDLVEWIKRLRPKATVILTAAGELPEYRHAALERGADHFLAKASADTGTLKHILDAVMAVGRD